MIRLIFLILLGLFYQQAACAINLNPFDNTQECKRKCDLGTSLCPNTQSYTPDFVQWCVTNCPKFDFKKKCTWKIKEDPTVFPIFGTVVVKKYGDQSIPTKLKGDVPAYVFIQSATDPSYVARVDEDFITEYKISHKMNLKHMNGRKVKFTVRNSTPVQEKPYYATLDDQTLGKYFVGKKRLVERLELFDWKIDFK